ncbi:hypothetical protein BJ508DRAFT_376916 [Ascobolus immersus RN42]|uniref:Integral membrane protein, Mpv17/PMP22 family n=1 Tax=Ascobolus immersus RN42 TaxID=1160509 RepID=A0A3N4I9D3_ASCIM|nr:hypothetical protein BJ508DRAFT_376916 [Ascobolus immersus RN42]
MPSPIATATLQSAFLSLLSNVIAQTISAYNDNKPFTLNIQPILQFVLYSLISTPPNFIWQETLEEWFPGQVPVTKKVDEKKTVTVTETRLSKSNTIKKFVTDQLVGAPLNTIAFLICMKGFSVKGNNQEAVMGVLNEVHRDFIPMHLASLKLWPAVGLISLIFVPVQHRIVFGSLIALGWNIYLGLVLNN